MKHLKYFKIFESLDYDDFTGDIEDLTKEEIETLYPFYHKDGEPDIKNDLWLVTILAPTKDIDCKATLVKNIKFPYEEEIQLKTDLNIEVFEISKYY
jgi:hypothetical protein